MIEQKITPDEKKIYADLCVICQNYIYSDESYYDFDDDFVCEECLEYYCKRNFKKYWR